jgi:PilZ domain
MELTAKTLAELLGALRSTQSNTELNKRKSPRVGLRVRADVMHATGGRMSVWVRDISAGGVNIAAPIVMKVGDDLSLLLANGAGKEDTIKCTVMHCRKLAHSMFAIGLKFNAPIAGSES